MEVKEITNKKEWEDFLLACKRKTFLQSWNWGEFQQSLGYKIWRLGIYDNGELKAVSLVIKHTARRGNFLLVPHGPVDNNGNHKEIIKLLKKYLIDLAKKEKVDFVRISPIWARSAENEKLFKDLGFRLRALHTHPESSWKLNIEKSEDEILGFMRKTTRYSIKQAEKQGVEVYQSFDMKDVEIFNKMHLEVVKHQKFIPFSLSYFQKEFSAFLQDKEIALFLAKHDGRIIGASYGIFWSGMAFYHHAALLPEYRKIPAAYLLQWTAIKEAKKRGCKIYDFWGYSDPIKHPKHPYSGPTLFKMGFGGYKDEYVKTQDLIISQKYWINYIIETIRRIKRGL